MDANTKVEMTAAAYLKTLAPSTAIKRLTEAAKAAIAEYNTEYTAGGEPAYPQWADDALHVHAEHASMAARLAQLGALVDGVRGLVMFKEQAA